MLCADAPWQPCGDRLQHARLSSGLVPTDRSRAGVAQQRRACSSAGCRGRRRAHGHSTTNGGDATPPPAGQVQLSSTRPLMVLGRRRRFGFLGSSKRLISRRATAVNQTRVSISHTFREIFRDLAIEIALGLPGPRLAPQCAEARRGRAYITELTAWPRRARPPSSVGRARDF